MIDKRFSRIVWRVDVETFNFVLISTLKNCEAVEIVSLNENVFRIAGVMLKQEFLTFLRNDRGRELFLKGRDVYFIVFDQLRSDL